MLKLVFYSFSQKSLLCHWVIQFALRWSFIEVVKRYNSFVIRLCFVPSVPWHIDFFLPSHLLLQVFGLFQKTLEIGAAILETSVFVRLALARHSLQLLIKITDKNPLNWGFVFGILHRWENVLHVVYYRGSLLFVASRFHLFLGLRRRLVLIPHIALPEFHRCLGLDHPWSCALLFRGRKQGLRCTISSHHDRLWLSCCMKICRARVRLALWAARGAAR